MSDERGVGRLELTPFGEWVRLYSVVTPPRYWQDLSKEVERVADEDGDWMFLLEERIAGLQSFLERRANEGEPKLWRSKEGTAP